MKTKQLEIGGHCFVRRPEGSFAGRVADLREGWARIIGKGSIVDTTFDEWFPIQSKCLTVEAA
jgi:hypothetical protein